MTKTSRKGNLMNPTSNRRVFVLRVIAGGSLMAAAAAGAAEPETSNEKLTEADPYAKSMGFRLDTNQVDKVKYPRHDAATQQCSKCQLFSAKAGEPLGACSFYGGRQVPTGGWCRNFKVAKAKA
jgi:High potential iron-sulfur protein